MSTTRAVNTDKHAKRRKIDARLSGRRERRTAIGGQFAPRLIELLESPAYRVMSRAAHLALARIEIEMARHGGCDNGLLPVTYADFESYGIHADAIAPAIRELVGLGFVEVTERGRGGNAEFRSPSKYRLTARHAKDVSGDGTHEWRRIETIEQAEEIAKAARKNAARKKQKTAPGFRAVSPPKTRGETNQRPPPETRGYWFTPENQGYYRYLGVRTLHLLRCAGMHRASYKRGRPRWQA